MFTSHKTNDKSFSLVFSRRDSSASRPEIIPLISPTAAFFFFVAGSFSENKLISFIKRDEVRQISTAGRGLISSFCR